MRILVISNLYPPYYIGGYELACKDIVDGLRAKGYDVYVLTSTYGIGKPLIEGNIYRLLDFLVLSEPYLIRNGPKFYIGEYKNKGILTKVLRKLKPELVYVWNMERLSWCLAGVLQGIDIPVVFAIFDLWVLRSINAYKKSGWLRYWNQRPSNRLKSLIERKIKYHMDSFIPNYPKMKLLYAHFFSRFLERQYMEANLIANNSSKVIYYGVPNDFFFQREVTKRKNPMKLLYTGQVMRHKGVHVIIEAFSILVNKKRLNNLDLTIIGPKPLTDYTLYLQTLIRKKKLEKYITFSEQIRREELIHKYLEHDVLLFATISEEPFGITLIEAMACGLPVVASPSGGTIEILKSEENCLLFPPKDALALANQIERLIVNPDLRQKLKRGGLKTVTENFVIDRTVRRIEDYLTSVRKSRNIKS